MESPTNLVFVIGIGASAGGITAMRAVLPQLPAADHIAYVLCQHLDPKHTSMLDEILQRTGSALHIEIVEDGQPLTGGRLYIVPPHGECSIRDGAFRLEDSSPSGARHTIDTLFASIAEVYGERAIGVILSGTGSDGLQGIRAIKGAGGLAVVQSPDDAEYPGMPEAVVRDLLADVIAPLDELGATLGRLLIPTDLAVPRPESAEEGADAFAALIRLLVRKTGLAFDQYKETTLRRRIERRQMITGETDLGSYLRLVARSGDEADLLKRNLLISVTSFFRDPDTFQAVREALRSIVERNTQGQPVRVWVAGCATGEEAYSIAMLLIDLLGDTLDNRRVQIFATDVDESVISTARRGLYLKSAVQNLPAALVARHFDATDGTIQVRKGVRDLVTFATQDLLQDPPFSRLDLVSCRNVLIYFKPEAQDRLLRTFHYVLNPDGFLVLGPSENVTRTTELFEPVSSTARVFTRTEVQTPLPLPAAAARPVRSGVAPPPPGGAGMEQQIRDALYERYAPPCVLLGPDFTSLFVHGDVSRYARLPQGSVTTNLLEMVDLPLRVEIRLVVQKAQRERATVRSHPVSVTNEAGPHQLTLIALPVSGGDSERGERTLLLFEDQPAAAAFQVDVGEASENAAFRIHELEQELAATRDHLQTNVEDLEASNEELQSINEEYQSTTEELQSANEELQTTNEELQSTNEELSTVNEELRVRTGELSAANQDLEDILNTAVSGIVVLDDDLRVTRYSAASRQVFDLLPTSIGRPLIAVGGSVDLALLSSQIRQAREQGQPVEHHLELGDKVFLVHLIPRDSGEAGLIISFLDVSEELQAVRQAQRLAAVMQDSSDAIMVHGTDGRILAWNRGAKALYGFTEAEALKMNAFDLSPENERSRMRDLTRRVMTDCRTLKADAVRLHRDGQTVEVAVTATPLINDHGNAYAVVTTERDMALERVAEAQRYQARLAQEERLTTAGEMAAGLAHELNQPLTAIVQFCDLAASIARGSRFQRRDELNEVLDDITAQAQRAADIITTLRTFVGRGEPAREDQQINDIIRHTVGFMTWTLESDGVAVNLDLQDGLPAVAVDCTQIEQVLVNLLRNARDAMVEAGSDPRTITISSTRFEHSHQPGVQVTVRDTGPGVPEAIAGLLFRPFQTTRANGLGMGLWISRSIVEAHGGRLTADRAGPGGVFRFTLPAGPARS